MVGVAQEWWGASWSSSMSRGREESEVREVTGGRAQGGCEPWRVLSSSVARSSLVS